jgi:alpha-L-fucosidase
MKPLACLLLFVAALPAAESYRADWESLDRRPTPQWYTEAKFGIFIHWGVYSVPAFASVNQKGESSYAEWYWNSLTSGRNAARKDGKGNSTWRFHRRWYGEDFAYEQFAPMFRAELFDPNQWADVFLKSGAKYVVLTSKHHEGFTLWPNEQAGKSWGRKWTSADIGPRRDLAGDLAAAVRSRGLKMGFYYSLYEWYNPLWLSDKPRYVSQHMHPQFKDLVTRYRPSLIFSDGEWDLPSSEWRSPELLAWLFNESPVRDEVVINDRWGKETRHKHGGYYTTEYTAGLAGLNHPWEESRGIGYSYGYNRMEALGDYRTGRELVLMLIDLVSRGGNLLLDIGPTADGRIPVIMQDRLGHIGRWLAVNGDAIYGTRARRNTRQWSEGRIPEMNTSSQYMTRYEVTDYVDRKQPGVASIEAFFTAKSGSVYAMLPRWPGREFLVKEIAVTPATTVRMLGVAGELQWKREGQGIRIVLPEGLSTAPASDAWTLQITHAE